MTVGVLALQGDFREHIDMLARMGVATRAVKSSRDLAAVDRLIIPGGESTAIGKLLALYRLIEPIRKRIGRGMPVWGTCAGAILMAKRLGQGSAKQPLLKVMDITARRNAFGRQLDSFETKIVAEKVSDRPLPTVFIRAPLFEDVGKNVKILATLPNDRIVAVQENKLLATCFHPELTENTQFHGYFLSL